MHALMVPDAAQVERWLKLMGFTCYLCDQCHGLHIAEVQELEGVLECRIFVEPDSLLVTTELEIRPSVLLPVMADLARLNMTYPALKVFVDVVDEALPKLVMCDTLMTASGISQEQFMLFCGATLEASKMVLAESLKNQLVYLPEGDEFGEAEASEPRALH